MNAVTGVGAPSYTSGVHWWKGATEALKQRPATHSAMPVSVSGSVARLPFDKRVGDRGEVGRAGRAVDQRQAVQQRGRADRADDQVLQPRLQRALLVLAAL